MATRRKMQITKNKSGGYTLSEEIPGGTRSYGTFDTKKQAEATANRVGGTGRTGG